MSGSRSKFFRKKLILKISQNLQENKLATGLQLS